MRNNILNITLLLLGGFFFAIGMILSYISFYKENNKHYILRNTFPFELNAFPINKSNIYGKIALFISFLCIGVLFGIYTTNMPSKYIEGIISGIRTAISISGILSLLSIGYLFFVPMKNVKLHLFVVYIFFAFSLIVNIAIGFMNIQSFIIDFNSYYLVFAIISFLAALFNIILILNPKLKEWAKLEEKANEDGTIIYVRPKYFVLAFTEWLFIFGYLLSAILLVFSII